MKRRSMDRREALALVALGVTRARVASAQEHLHTLKTRPAAYKIQFFTPAEHRLLEALSEMIIPADAVSPGAKEAKVAEYIDLVVSHSSPKVQSAWRSGLKAWDACAREKAGAPFLEIAERDREMLLNDASRNEPSPQSDAERFFADVKKMTLFAYYTSEIGLRKDLGYQGNAVLSGFPGCTHDRAAHR